MKNIFRISGVILLIFLIHSCKKDKPTLPIISTKSVTEISQTTVTSGGDVTDEGGAPIVYRGVCWNTTAKPTVENDTTTESGGLGSFTSNITNLSPNSTYYLRAYATNAAGTGYGNQLTFSTSQVAVPVLTTAAITSIALTTAISGGNISSDNGASVTSRGVCWGTTTNPTTSNNKTTDGTGTGTFKSLITGLTISTAYYVRAYAINTAGTTYGNEINFTTQNYGTVSDIDGNIYETVIIGAQVWMAENLKTTRYQNGDLLATTTPVTLDIISESMPKYQWAFNGNETYVTTYGRLYTWYAVTDNRNICPTGWHVPSSVEWDILISFLGGWYNVAGGKLKETGALHWYNSDYKGTNESGFTGLPGGQRTYSNDFEDLGYYGYWWSSTEGDPSVYAVGRRLEYLSNDAITPVDMKYAGYSVRCIKDN